MKYMTANGNINADKQNAEATTAKIIIIVIKLQTNGY